jgi:uncharacterized membrane protein
MENKTESSSKKHLFRWENTLPYYVIMAGIVGVISSLILSVEKLHSVADPNYVPSCSINPILSCGSVMSSLQAELFGVPHSFFGLIIFGALIAFGVLLLAGGKFAKWLWVSAVSVAMFGFLGVQYLVYQSVYQIKALCPWCMVVWIVSVPVFIGITVHAIRQVLDVQSYRPMIQKILFFIDTQNNNILIAWFLLVIGIITVRFWHYWSTLL